MIRRMSILAILLAVVVSAVPAFGGDVYMYDADVADEVDIGRFTDKGEVAFLTGTGKFCETDKGPAPEPYPHIHMWAPGYEVLGASNAQIDGILFINLGNHWVKNRLALVLWKITIPNANARMASEFGEDMTLTMWVDWDQNEMWDKDEVVIRKHLGIGQYFPTTDETLTFYYLSGFRVPDITNMMVSEAAWKQKNNKEIRRFWVRGALSCDDADNSPDGEQLFGEAEDYRVSYMLTNKQVRTLEASGE
jgi:hypothetical protein